MSIVASTSAGVSIAIASLAAVSDWRNGTIPNWLTLPMVFVSPFAYGLALGTEMAIQCIASIAISGAIPFLLFRTGAMGGGDVKLFAALGAIAAFDPLLGLQVEILAFALGMLVALISLAWKGELWSSAWSALAASLNQVLPTRFQLRAPEPSRASVRLGVPVFAATVHGVLPYLRVEGALG